MNYETYIEGEPRTIDCSIEKSIEAIGGKWSFLVIRRLFDGKKRFGELKKSVRGVSSKSLTETLRHLEKNGIIHREIYATVPPTVEYSLTDKGSAMHAIFHEMKVWGASWL